MARVNKRRQERNRLAETTDGDIQPAMGGGGANQELNLTPSGDKSMIYSNSDDHQKEREILEGIKNVFAPFNGLDFIQNSTNKTAIFDFHGDKEGVPMVLVDIKCRDIWANAYDNYFVSQEKVDCARQVEAACYMVYFFEKDKLVRIFDLKRLLLDEKVGDRDLEFNNRRAGEVQQKVVNTVPAKGFDAEFYLL